ncbi:hypothetical protein CBM2609_B90004 [Cupriavidus taiwanensis]|nr:hypothetical protein CBM2604_B80004 [Cupriavidus taiwanensis]SOZ33529.1 hypothetical protein CBM2609_B90004 [Cupriavidus taiwanensis]SOZ48803.1 hypothetical protein CBM2610_B70004 [Cupriavidus taiwanensis]
MCRRSYTQALASHVDRRPDAVQVHGAHAQETRSYIQNFHRLSHPSGKRDRRPCHATDYHG